MPGAAGTAAKSRPRIREREVTAVTVVRSCAVKITPSAVGSRMVVSRRDRGCAGEVPDDLGEHGWLVQGDERVAVLYLDQPSLREESGEASAMFGWHHAVAGCPDHERPSSARATAPALARPRRCPGTR